MKKLALFLLTLIGTSSIGFTQFITHGPVLGALNSNSISIYIRSEVQSAFTLEISEDSLFTIPLSTEYSTDSVLDNSKICSVQGLEANTVYFYRFIFNGVEDQKMGSFRTAPTENIPSSFTFVTGSCQETDNMKVYDVIPSYDPLLMLHLGDFTYPSYQLPASYPEQWASIPLSYQKRYEEEVMKDKILPFIPLAYMPDDDDNFGPNRTTHFTANYSGSFPNIINFFEVDSISQIERENCLNGYRLFFPGYPTIDSTEGHYHSFKIANAEFFVLDTRSMADSPLDAYQYATDSNVWTFNPPENHSILGQQQMEWLLASLSNSSAKWKFIATGVPFNPRMRRIIDAGVQVQGYVFDIAGQSGTGLRLYSSLSGYWAGYPDDISKLVNHINDNGIEGVIVISGDAHNNVMDDGTNSIFPEMCTSGLSVSSNELAYQMSQYAPLFGQPAVEDSLWNAGGNGLYNENFKNAFGKVRVFQDDSVECCIVDEDNMVLSCMTIYSDGTVFSNAGMKVNVKENYFDFQLFPNPAENILTINCKGQSCKGAKFSIYTITGQDVMHGKIQGEQNPVDIKELPQGVYTIEIRKNSFQLVKRFIKR